MKIALFGASGMIGQRIAREALARGHAVRAIVRNPERIAISDEQLTSVAGTALDAASVAGHVAGVDAVINATGPGYTGDPHTLVDVAHALIDGLEQAGVARLVVVGGAGSLEIAPGVQLVDTPDFPAAWKDGALAHRDALAVYRTANLDWTYISPAALIEPGARLGTYRAGTDTLLTDAQGQSRISAEDYAIAVLDEIERPQFTRRRMTVAY